MSRYYARKVDTNHGEIVQALRRCGALVHSLSRVGEGCPDLLVSWKCELFLLEVKDGSRPPSERKLTEDEARWHAKWASPRVRVVHSVDEALNAVGITKTEAA